MQQLIHLAMPLKQQPRQIPGAHIHVEPHIHIAQPEIAIQPMEVIVTHEPPKTLRSGNVVRKPDGTFDFTVKDQPAEKAGSVRRENGQLKVLIGDASGQE